MGDPTDEQEDGVIKKPMKGSFQRVGDRMAQEMSDKSPTESVRDDLSSSESEDDK